MKTKKWYVRIIFIGMVILLTQACGLPAPTAIPVDNTSNIGNTVIVDGSAANSAVKDGATLVYVPKGDFIMGGSANNVFSECQKIRSDCKRDWFFDEEPAHVVALDAFWIDQTEVTNIMYAKCVKEGVCKEPTDASSRTHSSYYGTPGFDNYPVIYVNWDMANTYCSWAGRRLPTEAEWEKAARGTDARVYPWGNDEPNANLLNYDSNFGDVVNVGSYESGKSVYGAYDMAGNVNEWVNDWYGKTYYQNSHVLNPLGPATGQSHVVRGGSWDSIFLSVRIVSRNHGLYTPIGAYINVGFRCARSEDGTQTVITNPTPTYDPNSTPDPIVRSTLGGGGGDTCAVSFDMISPGVFGWIHHEWECPVPPDRCSIFGNRNLKLTTLDWLPGSPLKFYFKMTGGVPGLEDKAVDDGSPWNYSVDIDGHVSDKCAFIEGYKERLYCSIELPSDYSATLQPITLTVNGCEIPIYRNPLASIPPLVSVDMGGGSDDEQSDGSGGVSSGGSGGGSSGPSCGAEPTYDGTSSLESWCSCMGGTIHGDPFDPILGVYCTIP